MGTAAKVCKDCGHELSVNDKFCSKCGTKVERETTTPVVTPGSAPTACEVCGHVNKHDGLYCEACGVKLPGRDGNGPRTPSEKRPKKFVHPKGRKDGNQSTSFKFEVWHYVVGALIVGLIGLFVYLEMTRDIPATTTGQQQTMQFPASQTPTTPPTKDILDAIERLEKTVKENPTDAGAKLLLANALHDAGTHDGSYFPRAIEAYKKYLKEKPGDPNARVDMGICYFELGKIDSTQSATLFSMAINEMELTLKNNPKHQAGAFNLAIVYLYSGDLEQSNKWLKKTVELNAESDLGKRAKAILDQHSQAG